MFTHLGLNGDGGGGFPPPCCGGFISRPMSGACAPHPPLLRLARLKPSRNTAGVRHMRTEICAYSPENRDVSDRSPPFAQTTFCANRGVDLEIYSGALPTNSGSANMRAPISHGKSFSIGRKSRLRQISVFPSRPYVAALRKMEAFVYAYSAAVVVCVFGGVGVIGKLGGFEARAVSWHRCSHFGTPESAC